MTTAASPLFPTITTSTESSRSVEEESDTYSRRRPVDRDNFKFVDIIKPSFASKLLPPDKDKERLCESLLVPNGGPIGGGATTYADEPGCSATCAADVSTSPVFIPLSPLLKPFVFEVESKDFTADSPAFPSSSGPPWGGDPIVQRNKNLVVQRTFPAAVTLSKDPEEAKDKELKDKEDQLVEKDKTTMTVGIPFITDGPAIGVMAMPMKLRHSIETALNRSFHKKRARMNEEMEKEMKESKRLKKDKGDTQSNASSAKDDSVATETSTYDDDDCSVNSLKTMNSSFGRSASAARGKEFKMLCQERKRRLPYAPGAGENGKIDRRRKCAVAPVVSESLSCGPIESGPASARRVLTRRSSTTASNNVTPSNTIAPSPASKTGMHGGGMITAGPCEISGVHLPMSKEEILGRRGRSWNVQCEKLLEAFEEAYIVLGDRRIVKAQIFFRTLRDIQSQYPDYVKKIHPYTPVDLVRVKQMLDEGQINPRDFHENVDMAFENWMQYFEDDENDNYRLAHRMKRLFAILWLEIDRGESAIEASYQPSHNSHGGFPGQEQGGIDLRSLYSRAPVATRRAMGRAVPQAPEETTRRRQRRAGRPPGRSRAETEELAIEMHEEILDGYKRLNERDQREVTEWLNRGGDYAEINDGDEWCFAVQSLKKGRRTALHKLILKLAQAQDNRRQAAGYNSGRRTQTSAGMNAQRQHSGYQKSFPLARREAGRNTGYDPALFSGNSSSDEPDEPVLPFRRNNPMPTPGRFGSGEMDRERWQPSHMVEHASSSLLTPAQNINRSRSPPPSSFANPRSFVPFSFAKPEKILYEPSAQQTHAQRAQQTSSNSNLVGGAHGHHTPSRSGQANAGSRQANVGAGASAGYMQGTPGTGHPQSGALNSTTHGPAAGGAYGATSHRTLGREGNNNNTGAIAQGQTHPIYGSWNHGMEIGPHNTSTSHHGRDDMANFGESRKMPGNEISKRPTAGFRSPLVHEGTYSMLDNADDVLAVFHESEDPSESFNASGGLAYSWPGTETSNGKNGQQLSF